MNRPFETQRFDLRKNSGLAAEKFEFTVVQGPLVGKRAIVTEPLQFSAAEELRPASVNRTKTGLDPVAQRVPANAEKLENALDRIGPVGLRPDLWIEPAHHLPPEFLEKADLV